ncbi:MAG: pseudouridine synthase [Paracoccaceae bacterium]
MTDSPARPESAKSERIAKVIARSGHASRRDAEKMILAGRVTLNGKVIDTPAIDVGPRDKVTIDGKPIDAPQETRVWLYYKPLGLVTTEKDEQGRRTIFDEMPEGMPRVLNVGRLDLNSEGLLLLTNDGGLKRRLELPETGWLRKYRVRVNGRPTEQSFDPLRDGITIDGEEFQPMEITIDRQQGANAWLTVGIREGKNREIRRAMTEVGLTVNRLIRISYGPFRLNDMKPGDVFEVRRKVLRDQLGDRLLTGEGDDAPARAPRGKFGEGERPARKPRFGDRPERGERGERGDRGDRPARSDRFERDGGERKGFGRQRDFGAPRGDAPPRPEGEERARKPRWGSDDRKDSRGPRREGAEGEGRKSFGGPKGKPRSEGFKPRGEGFKPRGDKPGGKPGGKFRSEGYKSQGGEGRKEGGKPRSDGFRSHGGKPAGGDKPRSGGFKSHGPKSGPRGPRRDG